MNCIPLINTSQSITSFQVFDWHPENYHNESEIPEEIADSYVPYHVNVKCFGLVSTPVLYKMVVFFFFFVITFMF